MSFSKCVAELSTFEAPQLRQNHLLKHLWRHLARPCSGFRVQGKRFAVQGLGFGIWGLGFRVWSLGFGVGGWEFGVWG